MSSSIQNMCTVILCLMEATCMQIRAEEQEDLDKQQVSLLAPGDSSKVETTEEGETKFLKNPPVNTIG